MRLTHVRLLASDFPSAFRFWRDVVGLPALWGDEHGSYADFDANTGRVAIFSARAMAGAMGASAMGSRGPDQVALIFAVDDVNRWYARLRERGAVFVTPPTDKLEWGVRVALFRDPEGNLIEINQGLPPRS